MRRLFLVASTAALITTAWANAAGAAAPIAEGAVFPNFTKDQLDFPAFGQTTPRAMSDYAGKVIVLFILGHS